MGICFSKSSKPDESSKNGAVNSEIEMPAIFVTTTSQLNVAAIKTLPEQQFDIVLKDAAVTSYNNDDKTDMLPTEKNMNGFDKSVIQEPEIVKPLAAKEENLLSHSLNLPAKISNNNNNSRPSSICSSDSSQITESATLSTARSSLLCHSFNDISTFTVCQSGITNVSEMLKGIYIYIVCNTWLIIHIYCTKSA